MKIFKEKNEDKKAALKIHLPEIMIYEVTEYMKWAEMKDKDHFIEEACKHVLDNDKKWQEYKSLNFEDDMHSKEESYNDIKNKMRADDDGMQISTHKRNLGEELKKK